MSVRKVPQIRFKGFVDDWEEKKLGDMANLTSSKRVHAQDYVEVGIPFYRGKEISELRENRIVSEVLYISKEKYEDISRLYGSPSIGDLLITAVGTIGNTWVVDSVPFYFKDGNLIWFRDIICDSRYLDYLISSTKGQKKVIESASGSNQKALTMIKLNELNFMFPNNVEQKQIGNLMSNIDNLITLHQRKLELLKDTKKSMLQKMFPKEGATVPEIRFKGFTGDWERCKIEKLLDNNIIIGHLDGNHGALYPRSEEFIDDINEVPYITANDFAIGKMDLNNCRHLPLERAKKFRKGIAKDGDVLFAHNATVGPVTILKTDREFCVLSTTVTYFRCDLQKIDNLFLACCLENEYFVSQYKQVMKQSTRNQVPILTQRKFNIILPNIIEQIRIGRYLFDLDHLITSQQNQLDSLKTLKKSMLQKMFI